MQRGEVIIVTVNCENHKQGIKPDGCKTKKPLSSLFIDIHGHSYHIIDFYVKIDGVLGHLILIT